MVYVLNHPICVHKVVKLMTKGAFRGCLANPISLRGNKIPQYEKFVRRPCKLTEKEELFSYGLLLSCLRLQIVIVGIEFAHGGPNSGRHRQFGTAGGSATFSCSSPCTPVISAAKCVLKSRGNPGFPPSGSWGPTPPTWQ